MCGRGASNILPLNRITLLPSQKASVSEREYCLNFAISYLKAQGRPLDTPIMRYTEGVEDLVGSSILTTDPSYLLSCFSLALENTYSPSLELLRRLDF